MKTKLVYNFSLNLAVIVSELLKHKFAWNFFSMETAEGQFAKQYNNTEPLSKRNVNVRARKEGYHQLFQPYFRPSNEEPIDLTQSHNKFVKREDTITNRATVARAAVPRPMIEPDPLQLLTQREVIYPENMYCEKNAMFDNNQLQGFFKDVIEFQATETKQAEILKAAKSLFSKRTRTLYHWMYPDTPKPQIKLAVANSWENLGTEEKQFYISQVLVRFGFPQCNLMVNPQLGGIKELPPIPDAFDYGASSRELQTALSSISEANPMRHEPRRRQGRPPGSKNKKPVKCHLVSYSKVAKDFQDDPELSNELEKFEISFDSFK